MGWLWCDAIDGILYDFLARGFQGEGSGEPGRDIVPLADVG